MGGHQVSGRGPGDDGYDEDGYDESQRAEILEFTRDGPTDGTVLTDLSPDLGEEIDPDEADELQMVADEQGEETAGEGDADDDDEDELQEEFDDGTLDEDDLDDGDAVALNP